MYEWSLLHKTKQAVAGSSPIPRFLTQTVSLSQPLETFYAAWL